MQANVGDVIHWMSYMDGHAELSGEVLEVHDLLEYRVKVPYGEPGHTDLIPRDRVLKVEPGSRQRFLDALVAFNQDAAADSCHRTGDDPQSSPEPGPA